MSELLLGGTDRKRLSASLPLLIQPRRREARPPPCGWCGAVSWWNGWRDTFPVVATAAVAVVERWQLPVPLGKCSCCHRAFTCYPPGFYPRRQYQLDVVADVVAGVALGGEPVVDVAAAVTASSTSARRWTAWVAALTRAGDLVAAAAQVDASVATVALPPPRDARHSRAAAVLAGFEALGAALLRVGVAVVERTGLGRVLGWQHRRHGDVYGVVCGPRSFSSAMAPGGRPATP
jgi:hypothetical protein